MPGDIAGLILQLVSPVGSFLLFVIGTMLVYRYVPGKHVPWRALVLPAVLVGVTLAGFAQLYAIFAPLLTRMAAIYGTFVAVLRDPRLAGDQLQPAAVRGVLDAGPRAGTAGARAGTADDEKRSRRWRRGAGRASDQPWRVPQRRQNRALGESERPQLTHGCGCGRNGGGRRDRVGPPVRTSRAEAAHRAAALSWGTIGRPARVVGSSRRRAGPAPLRGDRPLRGGGAVVRGHGEPRVRRRGGLSVGRAEAPPTSRVRQWGRATSAAGRRRPEARRRPVRAPARPRRPARARRRPARVRRRLGSGSAATGSTSGSASAYRLGRGDRLGLDRLRLGATGSACDRLDRGSARPRPRARPRLRLGRDRLGATGSASTARPRPAGLVGGDAGLGRGLEAAASSCAAICASYAARASSRLSPGARPRTCGTSAIASSSASAGSPAAAVRVGGAPANPIARASRSGARSASGHASSRSRRRSSLRSSVASGGSRRPPHEGGARRSTRASGRRSGTAPRPCSSSRRTCTGGRSGRS